MKILILEDQDEKFSEIERHVKDVIEEALVDRVTNWSDYVQAIYKSQFDLILLDLLVPNHKSSKKIEDHSESLIETTRAYDGKSFKTPAIVLTQYSLDAGDFASDLNQVDINVIPFNDHGKWRDALKLKLLAARPSRKFDVVILCALKKEAAAFKDITDSCGPVETISGLICQEATIGKYKTVIVRAGRMGLVASALAAAYSLERFEPRLICMSGICGGVAGESNIYDLLITQTCHQHDAGRWGEDGFKSEHYDVQLDVPVYNKLTEIASSDVIQGFLSDIEELTNTEDPTRKRCGKIKIISDAITSSGSAVLAEEGKASTLSVGQRKLVGFDMEIYSVYEAARHARNRTAFFAVKSVVDDGGANKGDSFHPLGCLLSAKFVVEAIRGGIADSLQI